MYNIGIDIGGTKIEIVAIDSNLNELYRQRFFSKNHQAKNIEEIYSHIKTIENTFGTNYSVGIGMPGWIQKNPKKATAAVKWADDNFISELEDKLCKDISIENDTKCFALSESKFGAGKGYNNALYMIIGTGVAAGIVINGNLYGGEQNFAGEFGKTIFPYHKQHLDILHTIDSTRELFTVEEVISGPALELLYKNQTKSSDIVRLKEIMERYRNGEENAQLVYGNYIKLLAFALSQISNLLSPEAIIIGGGVSNVDEIYKDLEDEIQRFCIFDKKPPKILKAKLGDSSGVIGAAFLE